MGTTGVPLSPQPLPPPIPKAESYQQYSWNLLYPLCNFPADFYTYLFRLNHHLWGNSETYQTVPSHSGKSKAKVMKRETRWCQKQAGASLKL